MKRHTLYAILSAIVLATSVTSCLPTSRSNVSKSMSETIPTDAITNPEALARILPGIDLSGTLDLTVSVRGSVFKSETYDFRSGQPRPEDLGDSLPKRRQGGMMFYGQEYSDAKVISDIFPNVLSDKTDDAGLVARVDYVDHYEYILFCTDVVFRVSAITPTRVYGHPILEDAPLVILERKSGRFF